MAVNRIDINSRYPSAFKHRVNMDEIQDTLKDGLNAQVFGILTCQFNLVDED